MDAHTHMHLKRYYLGDELWKQNRGALWPRLACEENPAEEMEGFYKAQFPGKQVTPLVFGKVRRASEACGLKDAQVERIFYMNAAELFDLI